MAIGDSNSDDRLLVPLSEDLVRKLDAARGDESYSAYVDRILNRAAEQAETELAEAGTVVGERERTTADEPTAISEPGEATNGDEFEQFWHQQMRTVFAWLWVGVVAVYAMGDLISTYFVVRTDIGYETNPLIAGLIEIDPVLIVLWKAVALLVMFFISETLLRKADHTRIPWASLVIPGALVIWGSFITGMNVMNIPRNAQFVASASILSAIVTVVVGYVLFDLVYQDFVEDQEDYDGFTATVRQWILDRPRVRRLRFDPKANRAARDLAFPGILLGIAGVVGLLVAILPHGSEFRSFLFRPTRYADLLLVSTGTVVVGLAIVLVLRQVDSSWAATIERNIKWLLGTGAAVAPVVGVLFLLSLTSSRGTGLLESAERALESVTSWFAVRIGPLARPGTLYIENSPLGLSVGEATIVMAVAGLLASLPMLVVIYRRTSDDSHTLGGA